MPLMHFQNNHSQCPPISVHCWKIPLPHWSEVEGQQLINLADPGGSSSETADLRTSPTCSTTSWMSGRKSRISKNLLVIVCGFYHKFIFIQFRVPDWYMYMFTRFGHYRSPYLIWKVEYRFTGIWLFLKQKISVLDRFGSERVLDWAYEKLISTGTLSRILLPFKLLKLKWFFCQKL